MLARFPVIPTSLDWIRHYANGLNPLDQAFLGDSFDFGIHQCHNLITVCIVTSLYTSASNIR